MYSTPCPEKITAYGNTNITKLIVSGEGQRSCKMFTEKETLRRKSSLDN